MCVKHRLWITGRAGSVKSRRHRVFVKIPEFEIGITALQQSLVFVVTEFRQRGIGLIAQEDKAGTGFDTFTDLFDDGNEVGMQQDEIILSVINGIEYLFR